MDKKSLLGIAVIAVLFLGFAYFSGKEQEQYQKELAAYEAYQDSLAAAARAEQPVGQVVADSLATVDTLALRERQVARLGEYLAAARQGEERIITLENDVMTVRFSTRGGQVAGVTPPAASATSWSSSSTRRPPASTCRSMCATA